MKATRSRRTLLAGLVASLVALACGIMLGRGVINAQEGKRFFEHADFGSPYQTGVPYALALAAIERYPDELGGSRAAFREKFGLLDDPTNPYGLPMGFVLHRDGLSGIDFVMTNCALCHTSEIDGQIIRGLGNRNIRLNALNLAITRVASREDFRDDTMVPLAKVAAERNSTPLGWRGRWATKRAIGELRKRAARETADAWAGLKGVDAGPGRNTPIEFAKATSRVPVEPPYGLVKLPATWVYSKRLTFGWDASIVGDRAVALSAVEFNKGMRRKDILRRGNRWKSVQKYLEIQEPPPYPGAIDTERAKLGREIFLAQCTLCHGTYGPGKVELYREKVVPLAGIETDPDRLRSVTPELITARKRGLFATRVHIEKSYGYVAQPLDGTWCRGPYLHNGSVPTMADLLRPAAERPVVFFVGGDTGYDLELLGISYEEVVRDGKRFGRRTSEKQFEFDTRTPGNSNSGHEYGTELNPHDRSALLEYLKQI